MSHARHFARHGSVSPLWLREVVRESGACRIGGGREGSAGGRWVVTSVEVWLFGSSLCSRASLLDLPIWYFIVARCGLVVGHAVRQGLDRAEVVGVRGWLSGSVPVQVSNCPLPTLLAVAPPTGPFISLVAGAAVQGSVARQVVALAHGPRPQVCWPPSLVASPCFRCSSPPRSAPLGLGRPPSAGTNNGYYKSNRAAHSYSWTRITKIKLR